MIVDNRRRRDLLNLWASNMMHLYRPDEKDQNLVKLMYEQMAFQESKHRPRTLEEPYYLGVDPIPTYFDGRAHAFKWKVPLTQAALVMLAASGRNQDDMRMLVASVYAAFLRDGPEAGKLLDVQTLRGILREGTAPRQLLDDCWEMQIINPVGEDSGSAFNLLDVVVAEDFKRN